MSNRPSKQVVEPETESERKTRIEKTKSARGRRYKKTIDMIVENYSRLALYKQYDKRTLRKLAADAIRDDLKEYHQLNRKLRSLYGQKYGTIDGKRTPLTMQQKRKLAVPLAKRRDEVRRNIEHQMGRGTGSFLGRPELAERYVGES